MSKYYYYKNFSTSDRNYRLLNANLTRRFSKSYDQVFMEYNFTS